MEHTTRIKTEMNRRKTWKLKKKYLKITENKEPHQTKLHLEIVDNKDVEGYYIELEIIK